MINMGNSLNRRSFLENGVLQMAGLGFLPNVQIPKFFKEKANNIISTVDRIKFGVVGINHGHIYSMAQAIINGGGTLTTFYALEDDLATEFIKKFPLVKRMSTAKEVFENKDIALILSSAIPNQRAGIAIEAMLNGKDVMVDKPGITDLSQIKKVRETQKKTGRIFSICYSERFENRATEKATALIKEGAIGQVLQTLGTGPHRMNPKSRPSWFFDKKYFGGIITDIASHQFDQFLHFTGSAEGKILASQVANFKHKESPAFEDFGDVIVKGNKGTGYIRVDWFTPDGLKTWGDGRLTILGTDGYIEIRKNIDITRKDSGSHLYIVNQKETAYIDCTEVALPYGPRLVDDIINRTETAMSQEHCFKAMELALVAQKKAEFINI
jgi:predicted dehydrogenase